MSKGNWLFNGTCCVLLLWGGVTFSKNWKAFAAIHQVSLLKNSPDRVVVKGAAVSAAPAVPAWMDIISRNPFSFDRNDIDIVPVVVSAPRQVLPKPVLFGTMDMGSGPMALLGDPGARQSSQNVKVGEKFKGWTVVKIEKKSVVVETDGVEQSIVMSNVPIDRDAGKTSVAASSPTVSTTAAPAAAPATPSSPTPPAAAPAGPNTMSTPFGNLPVQTP